MKKTLKPEEFIALVDSMREKQKLFFKYGYPEHKYQMFNLQREVDKALKDYKELKEKETAKEDDPLFEFNFEKCI